MERSSTLVGRDRGRSTTARPVIDAPEQLEEQIDAELQPGSWTPARERGRAGQTGSSRAVARQLAELQIQYAAVAGLKERYERLQVQLEVAAGTGDPERVVAQLDHARQGGGRHEAGVVLAAQPSWSEARALLNDPVGTAADRQRVIWLDGAPCWPRCSMVMVLVTTWREGGPARYRLVTFGVAILPSAPERPEDVADDRLLARA